MEGNIEEQEEQGIHEATIDLKDGADAFAMKCIETCEEIAGKVEVEAVLGLAWDILTMQFNKPNRPDELDDVIDDHLGFALRVGIAIGQMVSRRKN